MCFFYVGDSCLVVDLFIAEVLSLFSDFLACLFGFLFLISSLLSRGKFF